MNTHAVKTQENNKQSVENKMSPKQHGDKSNFQFVDSRPEAVAQRGLHEMSNNSPKNMQLKAFQAMTNNSPQNNNTVQLLAISNARVIQREPFEKNGNEPGVQSSQKLKPGIYGSLLQNVMAAPKHPITQDFLQKLQSAKTSVSELAHQGEAVASSVIDSGARQVALSSTNRVREFMHGFQKNEPGDWPHTKVRKWAYHKAVDAGAHNAELISNTAKNFAKGVGDKVLPSTMDRLHPKHLLTIMANPSLAERYLSQRKDQLMQPLHFYNNPGGFAADKWRAAKNSLWNTRDRFSDLDSGFTNKITHGGRALVEMTQGGIAQALGVGLGTYGLFNLPGPRERTNNTFNSMFPHGTVHGTLAREPLTKFLLTKQIARIRGNPALSAGTLAYMAMTNMGKRISESLELKQRDPKSYGRLEENNREIVGAARQIYLMDSITSTRKERE